MQALARYKAIRQQPVWNLLAEFKRHCQACYGDWLVELVLFGSLARSDFRPTSDVDVLAVLKDLNKGCDRELMGDFQMETAARTFDLISLLLFDEHEWLHGEEPIRQVILKEGIAI